MHGFRRDLPSSAAHCMCRTTPHTWSTCRKVRCGRHFFFLGFTTIRRNRDPVPSTVRPTLDIVPTLNLVRLHHFPEKSHVSIDSRACLCPCRHSFRRSERFPRARLVALSVRSGRDLFLAALSFFLPFLSFPFLSFPFLSFPFLSFPFLSFPFLVFSFLFFSFLFFSFLFFSSFSFFPFFLFFFSFPSFFLS